MVRRFVSLERAVDWNALQSLFSIISSRIPIELILSPLVSAIVSLWWFGGFGGNGNLNMSFYDDV